MSDETIPKLRVRPKLAADPALTAPASVETPAATSVPAEVPPTPAAPTPIEEPKAFRLKPKISLSVSPVEAAKPASAVPMEVKAPPPVEIPPTAPAPPAEPLAEDVPRVAPSAGAPKFSFKPKVEMSPTPPPVAKVEAPASVGAEAPAAVAAEVPLVAPVPNFPPPPSVKKPAEVAAEKSAVAAKPADRKKLLLVGGGVVGIAILGAGYFLFLHSAEEASPLPPPTKTVSAVVANPTTVQGQAVAAAQKAAERANEQMAPLNEVIKADLPGADVTPATETTTTVVVAPPPVAAVDLGPPPPSVAFREWVSILRIGSVRTGAKPRILLERTSYDVGDTVNQQLGITFEGYNPDTRMIIFKDRSGAMVERRN